MIEQAKEVLVETTRRLVQIAGARVVDETVNRLGLGRRGVRLTASSLAPAAERWEAEVTSWSPGLIADAAELVASRAMLGTFEVGGTELARIDSMAMRWLRDEKEPGAIVLNWPVEDREEFRREVLSNLTKGATTMVAATGMSRSGLRVVEIEIELRARTRAQLG